MKTESEHNNSGGFNVTQVLHELHHYLPAQAPLKDFIHHNTLHAFQSYSFFDGIRKASHIFGYKVMLSLGEYRRLYKEGRVNGEILKRCIVNAGEQNVNEWLNRLLITPYNGSVQSRVGQLRANWKNVYKIDMDALTHPVLFRTLCAYLDQGIAIWALPRSQNGFLTTIREMERESYTSFFRGTRAKQLLFSEDLSIEGLLKLLIGKEELYEHYLFDQQFSHQGWSGMVSSVETQPKSMLDERKIALEDSILFELLLEIDALDYKLGKDWKPLGNRVAKSPAPLFGNVETTELDKVLEIWQMAFEWTYYDQVLGGIRLTNVVKPVIVQKSFQALLCIDDRECSFRRYLEKADPSCETFGTPGFFGVEFYFQPEGGRFYTKLCPAPVTPKHLIKETKSGNRHKKDIHFSRQSHALFRGALLTNMLGFWSGLKLAASVFRPTGGATDASSFKHMSGQSELTVENSGVRKSRTVTAIGGAMAFTIEREERHGDEKELRVGFTVEEMAVRAENLLRSIGLVEAFAPLVYIIGHGSSSVNNPHYSAYDCGACSGRAGSVNARVMAHMLNLPEVRTLLSGKGIIIPGNTQFIGALHDTARDEVAFYDVISLSFENLDAHKTHRRIFEKALDKNAKERSRRLVSVNTSKPAEQIHEKIRRRSVSLFEPRPELNHATNALCIVGRRELTKGLFLDRRSFMNSYDYKIDSEGKYLLGILNAAAPVCGGINLEYYFSRVDNQKLGAGTKLPHNVMGLFAVANGIDGDLRPGLPSQMIEVHDPVRLLVIVEHFKEVVEKVIKTNPATYEWFRNEWVNLVCTEPETKSMYVFRNENFEPYEPLTKTLKQIEDLDVLLATNESNLPVYILK